MGCFLRCFRFTRDRKSQKNKNRIISSLVQVGSPVATFQVNENEYAVQTVAIQEQEVIDKTNGRLSLAAIMGIGYDLHLNDYEHVLVQESTDDHDFVQESTDDHVSVQESTDDHVSDQESTDDRISVQESTDHHGSVQESADDHVSSVQERADERTLVQKNTDDRVSVQESAGDYVLVQESADDHVSVQENTNEHVSTRESTDEHVSVQKSFEFLNNKKIPTKSNQSNTQSKSDPVTSILGSYPLNNRYENYKESEDEIEELYDSSDFLDDDSFDEKEDYFDHKEDSKFASQVLSEPQTLNTFEFNNSSPFKQEKENFDEEQDGLPLFSLSSEPTSDQSPLNFKPNQEMSINTTSLSSWLVPKETYNKNMSQSIEDRPILGALTVEELRLFSAINIPRNSPVKFHDELPIIGSVGTYWNNTNSTSCYKTKRKTFK